MDRLSVPEAAERLGVTQDAVRKRIHRDAISWEQDDDGRYYVYLEDAEDTTRNTYRAPRQDTLRDTPLEPLIKAMQDQIDTLKQEVADWKEEARRKDHLLAAALERIPAIEAPPDTARQGPSEPRESPVNGEEGSPYGTSPQDAEKSLHHMPYSEEPRGDPDQPRVPWWRRWFGL